MAGIERFRLFYCVGDKARPGAAVFIKQSISGEFDRPCALGPRHVRSGHGKVPLHVRVHLIVRMDGDARFGLLAKLYDDASGDGLL
jgi:hypothetical protein